MGQVDTNMQNLVIENERLRLEFDRHSGSLVSLFNKELAFEAIQYKPVASLFRITYPVIDPVTERDIRSHALDSKNQRVSRADMANNKRGKKLTLEYETLTSERGTFNVHVVVECELGPGGDEARFCIRLDNNDAGEVSQLYFPLISGLRRMEEGVDNFLVIPRWSQPPKVKNPLETLPLIRYGDSVVPSRFIAAGFTEYGIYPGDTQMQWMDYHGSTRGLYMSHHNKEGEFLVLWAKKSIWDPVENLSMAFVKYPYVQQGQSWTCSESTVSLHRGDWHAGADKYRAWLETWLPKRRNPEWLRGANGHLLIIGRDGDGTTLLDLDDLLETFKDAREHGVEMLCDVGWFKEGLDGRFIDFVPIDAQKQRKIYRQIHEDGGRVMLFVPGQLGSAAHPNYEKEGKKWAVKAIEGKRSPVETLDGTKLPVRNRGASPAHLNAAACYTPGFVAQWEESGHFPAFEGTPIVFMCVSCEEYVSSKILPVIEQAVDLGADVVLIDGLAMVSHLCFDDLHGHSSPDRAWGPGAIKLMERVLELGRKYNPDFAVCTEGICDVYTPYIGWWHSRIGPAPEIFRYTLPWVEGITGNMIDVGDFDPLYQSFLCGLALDVELCVVHYVPSRELRVKRFSLDPDLAKEVKRLNQLRQQNLDLLVDGVFRDSVGLRCTNGHLLVKCFAKKDEVLTTYWYQGAEPANAEVTVSLQQLGVNLKQRQVKVFPSGRETVTVEFEAGQLTVKFEKLTKNSVGLVRFG